MSVLHYGWVDARTARTYKELEEAYQDSCVDSLVPEFLVVDDDYYPLIVEQFYPVVVRGLVRDTSLGFAPPFNDAALLRWSDFIGRLRSKLLEGK